MRVNETELYRTIGERLRARREELGLKQSALAAEAGLRRTSITNIEAGRQKAPLHVLYALCLALDLEIGCLLPSNDEVLEQSTVTVELGREKKRIPPEAARVLETLLTKP
jgi:transcriptional regulator with XRE-family HTH domain